MRRASSDGGRHWISHRTYLPLVESREQYWSVIQRPDAVVDLLEPYPFPGERFAREDATILPKHHSVVSDLPRLEMTGAVDWR